MSRLGTRLVVTSGVRGGPSANHDQSVLRVRLGVRLSTCENKQLFSLSIENGLGTIEEGAI